MKSILTTVSALALSMAVTACGTMSGGSYGQSSVFPSRSAEGLLVSPNGMTLYTFGKDVNNAGTSACYDQCAINWPPFTVPSKTSPTGDYSVITRTDGLRQLALKGQPLYLFANDVKPGDKLGDGRGNGAWRVVGP